MTTLSDEVVTAEQWLDLLAVHLIDVPKALQEKLERQLGFYLSACQQANIAPCTNARFLETVCRVWACSDFVAESCVMQPTMLLDLFASGDIETDYLSATYRRDLMAFLNDCESLDELQVWLRKYRRREMVRIAWRDSANWAEQSVLLNELSWFAEQCIDTVISYLYRYYTERYGVPYDGYGMQQSMQVIAVGKLGGAELNFSSDVDLIFAFPANGQTKHATHSLANEQFFTRLAQKLIHVLSETTVNGYVLRVDMRLRPYGASGPIVMGFPALQRYYEQQGRNWERYALLKARVISGDAPSRKHLAAILTSFSYRPYIDYELIDSLREMQAKIDREIKVARSEGNVKRGKGGIRAIEFIVQSFQLIHGGVEHRLRQFSTLQTLSKLQELQYLSKQVVEDLSESYCFLRRVEHHLQMVADRQTHDLPTGSKEQARLAFALGYRSWRECLKAINNTRKLVNRYYKKLLAKPYANLDALASNYASLKQLWLGHYSEDGAVAMLESAGFEDPKEILRLIQAQRSNRYYRALPHDVQNRIDEIVPVLLNAISDASEPGEAFKRIITVLEALRDHTVYFALLHENPAAVQQLAKVCSASIWLSTLLARYPVLLAELLETTAHPLPAALIDLEEELAARLAAVAAGEFEQQMKCLRVFKLTQVYRAGVADVMDQLPVMKVSDHLSRTADAVVAAVLHLAWQRTVERYGQPMQEENELSEQDFAMIAYGKLGGLELGYASDLDIVFIRTDLSPSDMTQGAEPITSVVFFSRLAQEIIHLLSHQTALGSLYKIDTRLRPSGDSGLMVTSLQSYIDYEEEKAWTWEHQALVRARLINTGSKHSQAFDTLRHQVLSRQRDNAALAAEVLEMRERMLSAYKSIPADQFDLKASRGGMTDIEFIVQYGVLAYAHNHVSLLRYTDNIRILAAFDEARLLSQEQVKGLSDAYRAYRALQHRLALQDLPAVVPLSDVAEYRDNVLAVWDELFNLGS